MNKDTTKIIDKVRKLLNMTVEAGCTINEAASAYKQAQKLIVQHRISVSDLNEGNDEEITNKHYLYKGERVVHWKSRLASVLCHVNGAKMYYNNKYEQRKNGRIGNVVYYQVIGRDSDVQVIDYFFKYLTNEIERLCKEEQRRNPGEGKSFSDSFKKGAADKIIQRLYEAVKEVRDESTSTSIVKVDMRDAEVQKWAKEKLNLKSSNLHATANDARGYYAGVLAGAKISLNKGVSGSTGNGKEKLLDK